MDKIKIMERQIKLIWDFRGEGALRTAEHHEIHLKEYIVMEKLNIAITGFSALTDMHAIAFMVVKIGIIKAGNIGTSPVLDLLLDERADRPNIDVRVFGSGAKMNPEQVEDVVPKIDAWAPDFCIFISPNPGAPGPARARELLSEKDIPAVIIGDAPGKGKKDEMDEQGLGYIIVMADPMIGAKREWLDPTEMADFNANVLKVLAATGALRLVQFTIDDLIDAADAGNELELPKLIITANKAVDAAEEIVAFKLPFSKCTISTSFPV